MKSFTLFFTASLILTVRSYFSFFMWFKISMAVNTNLRRNSKAQKVIVDQQNPDYDLSAQCPCPEDAEEEWEIGSVVMNHRPTTVHLEREYEDPVVIMGVLQFNGGHESTVRVSDVEKDSFSVRIQEWNYKDGAHTNEQISWFVVESGCHEVAGGRSYCAGNVELTEELTQHEFGHSFEDPVVLGQVTSDTTGEPMVPQFHEVTSDGFSVQYQLEGANEATGLAEQFSWFVLNKNDGTEENTFACSTGSETMTTNPWPISWATTHDHAPFFFAQAQETDHEKDPMAVTLRYSDLTSQGVNLVMQGEKSAGSVDYNDYVNDDVAYVLLWENDDA